jgi:hypothetical protein
MNKQWEYRDITNPSDATMRCYGVEGWELVSVIQVFNSSGIRAFFKREIVPEVEFGLPK